MAINLSDYINIKVKPLIDHGCPLKDNCLSFEVDAGNLQPLPGKKFLLVTLTAGAFADGPDDGGTGREDGYTAFELIGRAGSAQFTQDIKKLQPPVLKPGEKAVIRGMAALALEGQTQAVLNADNTIAATATTATLTVARIHFALLSLKAGDNYLLMHGGKSLLALTANAEINNLCLVYREDTFPRLPNRIPDSYYFQLSFPDGEDVAGLVLDFYTDDPNTATISNRGSINNEGEEGWKPFIGSLASTADCKALRLVNSDGETIFALTKKP